MGLTTYSVIADASDFEKKIQITKRKQLGKETSLVRGLQGSHYILVEALDLGSETTLKKEFLLKYRYIAENGESGAAPP